MQIIVNKKEIKIPDGFLIKDLLKHLNYTKSVAIWVNGEQLLMAQYNDYKINDKDKIRIIKPLGGG